MCFYTVGTSVIFLLYNIRGMYQRSRFRIWIRIESAFLESLDPDPDPDMRFDPDPKLFFTLSRKKQNILEKIKPWIRIRIYFLILDPNPHETDADPKPWLQLPPPPVNWATDAITPIHHLRYICRRIFP